MLLCSGIEFEKAMSDWSMYELRDIVRDETRKSSDHIVPCGSESVGCADVYGAVHQDVDNSNGKGMLGGTPVTNLNWWEEASLSPSTVAGCSRGSSLRCLGSSRGLCDGLKKQTFLDTESSNEYARMGIDEEAYFSSNPVMRTEYATGCNNTKDDSLVVNDTCPNGVPDKLLDGPSLKHKDRENELMDYDWPDIGDFEDIDALFRNCDSTFGRGNTGTGDELSWFSSSSNAVNGSADAYESGLPSTCSGLSGLSSTSGHHRTICLGQKDQTLFDFHDPTNSQSFSNCCNGDAGQGENYAPKEQAYIVNRTSAAAIPQRSIDGMNGSENSTASNLCMKPFGSQFSPSIKRKDHPLDQTSSRSTYSGPGSVQDVPAQKIHSHVSTSDQNLHQISEPLSKTAAAHSHAIKLGNGFSMGHFPVSNSSFLRNNESEANSCSSNSLNYDPRFTGKLLHFSGSASVGAEGKRKDPNRRPNTGTLTESPSPGELLTSAASSGKRHYKRHDGINGNTTELNQNIKHPATDIDSLAVPEGSCISSGFDGQMSMEAASFQQLQDAMHKLDVRTKLRIRDSLYRLAKSAEQRHGVAVAGIYGGARGLEDGGTSNNSAGFLDAETETNPMDRSIAQLLFHSPSGSGTNTYDDSNMR